MIHRLAVSPDVHLRDLSDWFVLGTHLERVTGERFRVTVYDDVEELQQACRAGTVDLLLANAADTVELVRELAFRPLLRPRGKADEVAVVVAAAGPFTRIADLAGPLTVAATAAPDVERIGRILLEPADLADTDLHLTRRRNHTLVAKAVLTGEAHAGLFLKSAFDDLTAASRSGLRELICSRIHVVSHCLLAGPALARLDAAITTALTQLDDEPTTRRLLPGLTAPHGWEPVTAEEVEFMIDLMDALTPR